MESYYPMLKDALGMFLFLGIELSVLFILISFGVSLLQQYIPDSKIQAILSGKKGWGYIFAAALGAITPFCSCSTIPMLRGLLKAKAGFGPTMTFLFCSPLLNPIIMGLFFATFGAKVTLYYMAIALVVSIAASLLLDGLHFERYVIPESESPVTSCCGSADAGTSRKSESSKDCCSQDTSSACCTPVAEIPVVACCSNSDTPTHPPVSPCCAAPAAPALNCCDSSPATNCCSPTPAPVSSCCDTPTVPASGCCGTAPAPAVNKPPFGLRCKFAYWDAINQFKSVLIYLLLGVALGAFVYGFVPSDFIATYASGNNWYAIPIAAVIGIPLYVRTEVLIPLSAVLADKGMGLGAIMALIIGGGGASITELILLKSMFRMPMILAFLLVILGMAVSAGLVFQYAF